MSLTDLILQNLISGSNGSPNTLSLPMLPSNTSDIAMLDTGGVDPNLLGTILSGLSSTMIPQQVGGVGATPLDVPTSNLNISGMSPDTINQLFDPKALTQTTGQVIGDSADYLKQRDALVGNKADATLNAVLADLQARRDAVPTDVSLGKKILASLIGGIGGYTGNQALLAKGVNYVGNEQDKYDAQRLGLSNQIFATKLDQAKLYEAEANNNRAFIDNQYNTNKNVGIARSQALLDNAIHMENVRVQNKFQNDYATNEYERRKIDENIKRGDVQGAVYAKTLDDYMKLGLNGDDARILANKFSYGSPNTAFTPDEAKAFQNLNSIRQRAASNDKSLDAARVEAITTQNRLLNIEAMSKEPPNPSHLDDMATYAKPGNPYYIAAKDAINRNGSLLPADKPEVASAVRKVADEYGLSVKDFSALLYQESKFNHTRPDGSINHSTLENGKWGGMGIAQINPNHANDPRYINPKTGKMYTVEDLKDFDTNLRLGAQIYKEALDKYKDNDLALAAYNAGDGKRLPNGKSTGAYAFIKNYQATGKKDFTLLPKETQDYIYAINSSRTAQDESSVYNPATQEYKDRIAATKMQQFKEDAAKLFNEALAETMKPGYMLDANNQPMEDPMNPGKYLKAASSPEEAFNRLQSKLQVILPLGWTLQSPEVQTVLTSSKSGLGIRDDNNARLLDTFVKGSQQQGLSKEQVILAVNKDPRFAAVKGSLPNLLKQYYSDTPQQAPVNKSSFLNAITGLGNTTDNNSVVSGNDYNAAIAARNKGVLPPAPPPPAPTMGFEASEYQRQQAEKASQAPPEQPVVNNPPIVNNGDNLEMIKSEDGLHLIIRDRITKKVLKVL